MSTTVADAAETRYKPCSIADLPNEVLDHILSFVPKDTVVLCNLRELTQRRVPWIRFNRHRRKVAQVMVLLQVSRRFRAATLQSKFWLEFGFDFRKLVVAPEPTEWGHEPKHPVNKIIPILFQDDDFIRCLALKTEWAFPPGCKEVLLGICKHIPSFAQTARKLWICGYSTIGLVLNRLGEVEGSPNPVFCNVTDLGILDIQLSHLTRIAEVFPNIQHLFIALFLGTTTTPPGSLEALRNLETFELMIENYSERDIPVDLCLDQLPIASASTLTTLRIYGLGSDIDPDFLLTPFVHLQYLKFTDGFRDGFERVLASVFSKLISLELQIHSDDPWQQPISFTHPCLSKLEILTLEVVRKCPDTDSEKYLVHIRRCGDLVDAMTRTLTTVQIFTMDLVFLRFYALEYIPRLRQLQSVTWIQDDVMVFLYKNAREFFEHLFDD
jgi:hypothetical protein